jgi:uncharacterized protein YciI
MRRIGRYTEVTTDGGQEARHSEISEVPMLDTWSYDPGYLPGDPRYGLSPKELAEFFQRKTAQCLIRCTYGPDALARREGAMAAHLAFLRGNQDRIRFAGPLLANDGVTPTGSWLMVDSPSREDAAAFIADEGFNRAGMFSSIEIRRFAETSLEEKRQVDMASDPSLQLFVCEMIDGPEGAERRKGAGPAHHQYQESVMDTFIARGPMRSDDATGVVGTLYVIQVKDRGAAEAFVAAEPLNQAGVFSKVRIDRWRFGKGLSP